MGRLALTFAPFHLRLKTPVKSSRGVTHRREGFRIECDWDGVRGVGEAACAPELGTETFDACATALRQAVQSSSPLDCPATLPDLQTWLSEGMALANFPAARHGVELAILDAWARREGKGVARLLSSTARTSVEGSALLYEDSPEGLSEEAKSLRGQGFKTFKLKVGREPLHRDAVRLMAVREAVGLSSELRIDANGCWSEAQALVALRGLSPLRLSLCEQPVAANQVAALRRIRRAQVCRIAADESLVSTDHRRQVLDPSEPQAADVWVLKPMLLGGLVPALALAREGQRRGIGAYVTTSLDGKIARAGATHLAAAIPVADWANGLLLRDGEDPFPVEDGRIQLTTAGLGLGV